ncbi:4'-phosphopantetheinyl transferase family protein [Paraliomyxa miuraensis]|uniref:4'-phosphopantetheinyl transferase family protein n=1 Tax=Paraliomyxa miuraensis TaxID=376150 RepID=UPI002253BD69|nr:4'-phosphopantetheinyl transferase superfamily protein [Paraliomyxa miuraensis]MCX4241459.1 4'-phosphopantetheinyl transferase superfamily protein [Paraliomyxa miuraensis]
MTAVASTTAPGAWLVHLWAPPEREARLLRLLSEDDRQRCARFVFPWLETRFAVAHAALRVIASRHGAGPPSQQRWTKGPHGKPALVDSAFEINLSHAGDWALVAVSHDGPVGVDIEALAPERVSPGMVKTVTSELERAAFATLCEPQHSAAFFRLWVRKEAMLKALGTGLTRRLGTIDVPLQTEAPPDGVVLRPPVPGRRPWLWDLPAPLGYLAAMVVLQPEGEPARPPGPLQWLSLDDLDPPPQSAGMG